MNKYNIVMGVLIFGLCSALNFESSLSQTNPKITEQEISAHIKELASDELRGRMSGTRGAERAADYIALEFESYGLEPLNENGDYLQSFTFRSAPQMGLNNFLDITTPHKSKSYSPKTDFMPIGFSTNGEVSGEAVFVGYGITAEGLEYDDYTGVDVEDKIAIVLRYSPEGDEPESRFYQYSSLRYKAMNAREHGARGVLFVTPTEHEASGEYDNILSDMSAGDSGVGALLLRPGVANTIFNTAGYDLKSLEKKLDGKKPFSFPIKNISIEFTVDLVYKELETSNVVGYIEGSDPGLKDRVLIIGAHYDHIGLGGESSRARQKGVREIHNGADDNASGVAGLLELAEYFSSPANTQKFTIVFIAFAAEEIGLLGASHYVKNPLFALDNTVAMLNMDMIGRLRKNKLTVFGVGSSDQWKELLLKANRDTRLKLHLSDTPFAPSDQSVFYSKQIPVLHFFTGLHGEYHTPGDDWHKINARGQKSVLELMSSLIQDLSSRELSVAYSKTNAPVGTSARFKVYLGTIPDYSSTETGVRLMGVQGGSPAEKAGLTSDDVILGLGGHKVSNIYDYVYALRKSKQGVETDIVILRGNKEISLKIVPESR